MKLLLYCTKSKPLFLTYGDCDNGDYATYFEEYVCDNRYYDYEYDDKVIEPKDFLNGKIIAECDFEVEEIVSHRNEYETKTLSEFGLCDKSCLTHQELFDYLRNRSDNEKYNHNGYAIHIKNLNVFYKSKELSEFYKYNYKDETWSPVNKAPQNMMQVDYINIENNIFLPYILISIRPEWLCKILNGEKTIEIRKKVLKEMH